MLEPVRYRLRRDFEVLGERPNGGKIPGRYCLPQHSVLSFALHASPTPSQCSCGPTLLRLEQGVHCSALE